jgi:hypothetical protein
MMATTTDPSQRQQSTTEVDAMDVDTTVDEDVTLAATTATENEELSSLAGPTSLQRIVQQFHAQIARIEALERRIDARAVAARRRVCLILDGTDCNRNSHARLYISHSYTPEITAAGAMAALMQKQQAGGGGVSKPSPAIWTMHVEGKLLIDHLDHASAVAYDKKIGYVAPTDDLDRSRGEEEESDKQRALKFTHFCDKVVVTFQTVFELLDSKKQQSQSPKKKSSRRSGSMASGKSNPAPKQSQDEADPRTVSSKHQVVWKCSDTEDADMWSFQYPEPASPDKTKWKMQSVIAWIELYRRQQYVKTFPSNQLQLSQQTQPESINPRYRICSAELQNALFPHHGPVTTDVLTGLKRKREDFVLQNDATIPVHNEVHIPSTLTMSDIANAFFVYIQGRRLVTHDDVVQSDEVLQDLLGMEQFSYSQLRQLLFQRQLIQAVVVEDEPVRVTYILEQDSACVLGQSFAVNDESAPDLSLLQLDMDITVPCLFPYRARELLRRIKRRELEYTSSRTKARYLLSTGLSSSSMSQSTSAFAAATAGSATNAQARRVAQAAVTAAKDEDERLVRTQIEKCVTGQGLSADLIPVQLALAKAAPPSTEARMAGHLEARMAHLLSELQERVPAAARAWQVVEACQKLMTQE